METSSEVSRVLAHFIHERVHDPTYPLEVEFRNAQNCEATQLRIFPSQHESSDYHYTGELVGQCDCKRMANLDEDLMAVDFRNGECAHNILVAQGNSPEEVLRQLLVKFQNVGRCKRCRCVWTMAVDVEYCLECHCHRMMAEYQQLSQFSCDLCKHEFYDNDSDQLGGHMKQHHDTRICRFCVTQIDARKCPYCRAQFTSDFSHD